MSIKIPIYYHEIYDLPLLSRPELRKWDCSSESSGFDLYAAIDKDITLEPMHKVVIPHGFSLIIPRGHEGQIRPRSGLAAKHGITVLNSPGTIDAGYRGEVKTILINLNFREDFVIKKGMRISQLVFSPDLNVELVEITKNEFDKEVSERGSGGFGSTGE